MKQLLMAKDKVARSLGRLESVSNFTEFVKAFSQFGAEMVELAHMTGDRQVSVTSVSSRGNGLVERERERGQINQIFVDVFIKP